MEEKEEKEDGCPGKTINKWEGQIKAVSCTSSFLVIEYVFVASDLVPHVVVVVVVISRPRASRVSVSFCLFPGDGRLGRANGYRGSSWCGFWLMDW